MRPTHVTLAGLRVPADENGKAIIPRLAGGEDTPEEAAAKAAEAEAAKQADEAAAAEVAKAEAEAAAAAKAKEGEGALGDAGKAALAAERKARKDAEKRAKDAEAKIKEREEAEATDLEKATKRAEEAEQKNSSATTKLRTANLLTALAGQGISGANGKAVARLLDSVEYDDETDEPTNLDDAITAAKAEYGEAMFKGAKPKAPAANGGGGNEGREGPELSAEELEVAKSMGMTPEEYANFKSPTPTLPDKKKTE